MWGDAVGVYALGEIPVTVTPSPTMAGWWQTVTTRAPYNEDDEIVALWFEWMNYYHG